MRTRNRNPMPRALWLTIAFDGRGRPDPALGPARRLHTDHRHRARGAASVSGPPRMGRDPRFRDVAHLRARPPCPRRTRRARGRAHDGARRAAHRDPGGASVARPCSRGRPDVRRLPALRPDRARRCTGGGSGTPLARSANRRPARRRARGFGGAGAVNPRSRRRLGRGGRDRRRQRRPERARRGPGAAHALLPLPGRPRPRPANPARAPPARGRALRRDVRSARRDHPRGHVRHALDRAVAGLARDARLLGGRPSRARAPRRPHRAPGAHARRGGARLHLGERLAPDRRAAGGRRAPPRLGRARHQPGRQRDPLLVPARCRARPVPAGLLRRPRGHRRLRRRRDLPRPHRHRAPPRAVARVGGGHLVLVRVLQLAYFMAPAYVANMAPPFVRYWKGWNRPISRRWLGTHKTVLGFVLGVVAATLTTFVEWLLAWSGSLVAYEDWPLLGVLFGAGAMAGDSAKSFFKRRLGVEPGRPWIPFDQLVFVLGALVLVSTRVTLTWADVATILLLSFCGHILVNHLGCWLGIRDTRW